MLTHLFLEIWLRKSDYHKTRTPDKRLVRNPDKNRKFVDFKTLRNAQISRQKCPFQYPLLHSGSQGREDQPVCTRLMRFREDTLGIDPKFKFRTSDLAGKEVEIVLSAKIRETSSGSWGAQDSEMRSELWRR